MYYDDDTHSVLCIFLNDAKHTAAYIAFFIPTRNNVFKKKASGNNSANNLIVDFNSTALSEHI